MIRPIQLGCAKVTFAHEYDLKKVQNSKTGELEMQGIPRATTVTLVTDREEITAKAACSHRDRFTYEVGRKTALKKAFATVNSLTKEERTRIWEEYNKLKPGGRW